MPKVMPEVMYLKKYKKQISLQIFLKILKKSQKMLFFVIIIGAALGLVLWHYFIEGPVAALQIPQSKNITFNEQMPLAVTAAQIAAEFENSSAGKAGRLKTGAGRPILLYIYTSWCKICRQNFPVINEIAREFQNTQLQFISLAIDRNLEAKSLHDYLNKFGDIYFQPRFLVSKEGFLELLRQKNIRYNNYVPFTVLIAGDGTIIAKFSGKKSKKYLRNKIIKELQFLSQETV
jgi:thiol-disulfide isomerase/thioredoxin